MPFDGKVKIGDRIKTLRPSIDAQKHANSTGVVTGFTRFSSYHPQEVSVRGDGWSAWFWLADVERDMLALADRLEAEGGV